MANVDNPTGFTPVRVLGGGQINSNTYYVKASQTIFKGDLVAMDATGTVYQAAAGAGIIVIGVAAEYKVGNSSGTTPIQIYDNPFIIYKVQVATAAGALTQADVFLTCDHVTTHSGSTTSYLSGMEAKGATGSGETQMRILGLYPSPDNEWGTHQDVEVILVEHALLDSTTI